jgi:hypothetical protein
LFVEFSLLLVPWLLFYPIEHYLISSLQVFSTHLNVSRRKITMLCLEEHCVPCKCNFLLEKEIEVEGDANDAIGKMDSDEEQEFAS